MDEINQSVDQFISQAPNAFYSGLWDGFRQIIPVFAPYVAIVIVFYIIRIIYKQWKKRKK